MIACNLRKLKESLRKDQRWLGVDLGTKTIGLAISDVTLTIATPLETLRRSKFSNDAEALKTLIKKEHIGGLIFGLPLNMDCSEGSRCQSVRQFAENLEKRIDLPMIFWDERLSTVAVTRTLLDADASRKRRSEVVDKMAAAYILQGVLDRLNST